MEAGRDQKEKTGRELMKCLNDDNGAAPKLYQIAEKLITEFPNDTLVGAEFGIAYGGGPEKIGAIWNNRGIIHGFDTFESHPKELAYSQDAHEAFCMDPQYEKYGRDGLSFEFQRAELDRQGLTNVVLHKGKINRNSLDNINKLHYVLLDMDLITSMVLGYELVREKIIPGGYLCLHDVVPRGHLTGLYGLFLEIMATGKWELIAEMPEHYLVILRRREGK